MRVRVAFWQYADTEHYGAIVLVGARSLIAAGSSIDLLGYALDQSLNRTYGEDWSVAALDWLGRLNADVAVDQIVEAWENAA